MVEVVENKSPGSESAAQQTSLTIVSSAIQRDNFGSDERQHVAGQTLSASNRHESQPTTIQKSNESKTGMKWLSSTYESESMAQLPKKNIYLDETSVSESMEEGTPTDNIRSGDDKFDNKTLIPIEEEEQKKSYTFSIRQSIVDLLPENCTCMLCCTTFDNPYELQVHLVQQLHLPREKLLHEENYLYPLFDCIECNAKRINKYHPCMKPLVENLLSFAHNLRDGSPLTCVLCEGKRLPSVHHLILHIITYHGFRNKPLDQSYLSCPLCFAIFRTRNSLTIEAHALDEHLPEMVVKKQKLMHPEGQSHNFTMRHFSCYFENQRYNAIAKESTLQNCQASYTDLSGLIGHLCYAHYPLPAAFPISKTRPITCNACQFRFANRTDLRDHVLSSHNSFSRFRATTLSTTISFNDHCDPKKICHICWSDEGSVERLQTHILVYHVGSWRYCGFCTREICKSNETMNPVILYLTMERHLEHHKKQLIDHFEEMLAICQLKKPAHKLIIPPNPYENFFERMEIHTHKVLENDRTDEIMARFRMMARSESFDFDDFF